MIVIIGEMSLMREKAVKKIKAKLREIELKETTFC
jgi:hypothetical protein